MPGWEVFEILKTLQPEVGTVGDIAITLHLKKFCIYLYQKRTKRKSSLNPHEKGTGRRNDSRQIIMSATPHSALMNPTGLRGRAAWASLH
jgi:hypothetical protein